MAPFRKILLLSLMLLPLLLHAQQDELKKTWVFFTDKGSWKQLDPSTFLSAQSLERRQKQRIPVDFHDYPVNRDYVQQLASHGIRVLRQSKWLNAVSVMASAEDIQWLQEQPYVSGLRPVMTYKIDYPDLHPAPLNKTANATDAQINMIGLNSLHANGFTGDSILIAVMDNGFQNVSSNPAFNHLYSFGNNKIIATRDFVDNDFTVYDDGLHGAWTFSILAAMIPGQFTGAAPNASYILCTTENDASETHQEEDNWVAAAEWCDSLGAQIFSTSLGYSTFDAGQVDYTYADMDGNTTIITIGADMAASRGILVINSAGNEGSSSWQKITAPSDGDSVLAIGAVDEFEQITSFSSIGPSYDGRIKPDVMAMGGMTAFVHTDGIVANGNGTSFSCPLIVGFAACLWQTKKSATSMDVFHAIRESSDRYLNPDTLYGYGIPNGPEAYLILNGTPISVSEDLLDETGAVVYPNPVSDDFTILFNHNKAETVRLELFDLNGKQILKREKYALPMTNRFSFSRNEHFGQIPDGFYLLRITSVSGGNELWTGKLEIVH